MSKPEGDKGLVYVATGRRFVDEAAVSFRSAQRWMPEISAVIFTDEVAYARDKGFERIEGLAGVEHGFADKVGVLQRSPFTRSLFLDTDTFLCAPVPELWEILRRYDVAAVAAPMRETWPQPDLPSAFPEVNSGVIAWRQCEATDRLWQSWSRLYAEHRVRTGQTDDQPSLRRALYESEVHLWSLPPEYNFRTVFAGFAGRGPVKILHGRHADSEAVAQKLNAFQGCRVVFSGDRDLRPGRVIVLGGSLRFWLGLMSRWVGLREGLRDKLTAWWRGRG